MPRTTHDGSYPSDRRRWVSVVVASACGGCGTAGASPDAATDDAAIDAAVADATPVATACVTLDEPQPIACAKTTPIAATARTVIDLRHPDGGVAGRCDDTTDVGALFFHAFELPTDPAAYPLVIRLSSVGFAGACSVCAEPELNGPVHTAYGVGFRLHPCETDLDGNCLDGGFDTRLGLVPAVRVSAPWTVGAGGCGEACAWPCLGGYQEFGRLSCLASHSLSFGVATDHANAADAEVYVDLVPWTASPCCPYACP